MAETLVIPIDVDEISQQISRRSSIIHHASDSPANDAALETAEAIPVRQRSSTTQEDLIKPPKEQEYIENHIKRANHEGTHNHRSQQVALFGAPISVNFGDEAQNKYKVNDQLAQRGSLSESSQSVSIQASGSETSQPRGSQVSVQAGSSQNIAIQRRVNLPPRPKSIVESLKLAFRIWCLVVTKALFILVLVVSCMCAYYIPARTMTEEQLHSITDEVYDKGRGYIRAISYYTSIILIFLHLFSFRCSRAAIFYVIIPCALVDVAIISIYETSDIWLDVITNATTFISGTFSFYVVKRCTHSTNTTPIQELFYDLTKDGTPMALLKGVVGLYAIVAFFVQKFLPFLNTLAFLAQVLCRLFLFPLLFFVSSSYQTFVILKLSQEHMDRRMIINHISSLYIKFIGRIVLANLSTGGTNIIQYILINVVITSINSMMIMTFKKRISLSYDFLQWLSNQRSKLKRGTTLKALSIVRMQVLSLPQMFRILSEKERHLQKLLHIRRLGIYQEMGHEIIVIAIAPLLMYFLDPIFPFTSFNTISTIRECFVQIFIQFVIVCIGDLASLAYVIHEGSITYNPQHIPVEFKNKTLYVFFSVFCVSYAQYFISI